MKVLKFLFVFLVLNVLIMIPDVTTTAEARISKYNATSQPVYIYYFYFTPRCEECLILEKTLVKFLNENYSRELKDQLILYKTINLTDPDPESKKIAQDLKVRRQLLLIISGDIILNVTKDAFRYAETQYDLFSISMKKSISQVLTQ